MFKRQTKNQKERLRVRNKRKSLDILRTLILRHEIINCHYDQNVKRWTEFYTLTKTLELIQYLEYLVAQKAHSS